MKRGDEGPFSVWWEFQVLISAGSSTWIWETGAGEKRLVTVHRKGMLGRRRGRSGEVENSILICKSVIICATYMHRIYRTSSTFSKLFDSCLPTFYFPHFLFPYCNTPGSRRPIRYCACLSFIALATLLTQICRYATSAEPPRNIGVYRCCIWFLKKTKFCPFLSLRFRGPLAVSRWRFIRI